MLFSTGLWCVPGFGVGFGFVFALEPSELQKKKPKCPKNGTFISVPKPGTMHEGIRIPDNYLTYM